MSSSAILMEGVSKKFKIGARREDTLRDRIANFWRRRKSNRTAHEIWALKDIDLEVQPGEVLGIIGRNGAGKSTLLKLLAHITQPTEGRVTIRGRVGSLLEVGTGFHTELTGRENIFLNGAILGMKRAEIQRKFDEIVAFSEVEKFLDTPVKFYSSGMHMRLAFAVAAHLEPEIMLVDEVLAVGDVDFQKKCLGKMDEVTKQGRTVLFVSHNMVAVQSLCPRVIWLVEGRILKQGNALEVTEEYLNQGTAISDARVKTDHHSGRTTSIENAIKEVWLENDKGEVTNHILMGKGLNICYRFESRREIINPVFSFRVEDHHGRRVFNVNNLVYPHGSRPKTAQSGVVKCHFPSMPIQPGNYFCSVSLIENDAVFYDFIERIIAFTVEPCDFMGTGRIFETNQSVIYIPARVSFQKLEGMDARGS